MVMSNKKQKQKKNSTKQKKKNYFQKFYTHKGYINYKYK